ncbi:MAG: Plug domain-containing protein [Nitrospiraceae bacterium]|nr:Plug domain-containing protein [Nitrospiraceae bacterium]
MFSTSGSYRQPTRLRKPGIMVGCLRGWFKIIARTAGVQHDHSLPSSRGHGTEERAVVDDLIRLSLDDLMNIKTPPAFKNAQPLVQTASTNFVLTQEAIRRMGMASIPEALRMVPGYQVAQPGFDKWAVSSHGFNERGANKLLVLIDRHNLYTVLFSNVYRDIRGTFSPKEAA